MGWFNANTGAIERVRSEFGAGATLFDPAGSKSIRVDGPLDYFLSTVNVKSRVMFGHVRESDVSNNASDQPDQPDQPDQLDQPDQSYQNHHHNYMTTSRHPFQYGKLLWMHNGGVPRTVMKIDTDKDAGATTLECDSSLQHSLIKLTKGKTSTSFAGALFASLLPSHKLCAGRSFSLRELENAMIGAVNQFERPALCDNIAAGEDKHRGLNFAATDGNRVVAMRCVFM